MLDHSKLGSAVRYLGIEVVDALEISEQTESWLSSSSRTGHTVRLFSGIMLGVLSAMESLNAMLQLTV